MAHLATHMTLDVLVATVADLEARVIELKRAANTLADMYSLQLPYMDVGVIASTPMRRTDESESADSQD
ncbi:MAG: hypothetical protein HS104_39395 [Polyangiaceae bacterium]|nr:hypothetical protein [Polyangiaceae bacterium]MCL4756278.1 hypothetical protein [Myxococcales bacterium]